LFFFSWLGTEITAFTVAALERVASLVGKGEVRDGVSAVVGEGPDVVDIDGTGVYLVLADRDLADVALT
jgi:hypothetical protein